MSIMVPTTCHAVAGHDYENVRSTSRSTPSSSLSSTNGPASGTRHSLVGGKNGRKMPAGAGATRGRSGGGGQAPSLRSHPSEARSGHGAAGSRFPTHVPPPGSAVAASSASSSAGSFRKPVTKCGSASGKAEKSPAGKIGSGGGKKSAYKHVPHALKPVHLVAKRNARERRRVQAVNSAFLRLRKHVPYEPRHKRLSKVKTLRVAITYIHHLQDLIQEHDRTLSATTSPAAPQSSQHHRHQPHSHSSPVLHPHHNRLPGPPPHRFHPGEVVQLQPQPPASFLTSSAYPGPVDDSPALDDCYPFPGGGTCMEDAAPGGLSRLHAAVLQPPGVAPPPLHHPTYPSSTTATTSPLPCPCLPLSSSSSSAIGSSNCNFLQACSDSVGGGGDCLVDTSAVWSEDLQYSTTVHDRLNMTSTAHDRQKMTSNAPDRRDLFFLPSCSTQHYDVTTGGYLPAYQPFSGQSPYHSLR